MILSNVKKAPCKECNERNPGCHDKCSKYKEFRSNLDNKKRMILEEKKKTSQIFAFKHDSITKSKRKKS